MPPGAPEYATELEDYERRGAELAGKLFSWWDRPVENLPEWMQKPEEFIRRATAGGLGRAIRAFERPEERALLGGRPGEELYREPGAEPQVIEPEDYKVLFSLPARLRAVEAKKAEQPKWLQYDPLGLGTALAEIQVGLPATLKWWEAFTTKEPAARRVEQIGAVGLSLLQEPAIGLEQLTGAAAVMARPESRDLTVEDWYPLTTKTWSLAYHQAKGRLGLGPREDPQWGEDVLGKSLMSIADGTATAEQIALSRERLGAELGGQIAADPLNLLDWMFAANKAARGKALSAAQAKMLDVAQAAPDARAAQRQLATLQRGLAEAGLGDVEAFRKAAEAGGATMDPGTLDKFADLATKPFQITPEAKAVRDLEEMTVALAPALDLANSGDEALQLMRMWADDPASLAPMFGRVPESLAGQKTGAVLNAIIDQIADLPSIKGPDFNPAKLWVDIDQLAHDALRLAHGYEEPGRIGRFFLAYKRLMSEVYLNAVFSPGYVIRNTLGDAAAMATDGLLTFEHADDIDNFVAQFGDITTRRLMTEGAASREALTGEGAIKSVFPGVVGRVSEKGQEITRFAEPVGRLPLGEESRYKRAIYTALKRFWNENAPGLLPDLPDEVLTQLGPQAEHMRARIAHEPTLEMRRQALTDFLEGTKGSQFEPTRYLDADDLDSMSPVVLRNLREDLAKLDLEHGPEDLREVINRAREAVDEAEAERLAQMEDLPARIHVTTDVDEAEIADELVDDLHDIVARTGDERLADEVEEVKRAIPRIEEELTTARREMVDDLITEPTPEGLEILTRANADVEDLRNSWRQTANRLRQETKAAYDANPLLADELWSNYFRAVNEGWSDLARQRIDRFREAGDQLARLRRGERLDDILGATRRSLAEDRLLRASAIPDRPVGFLPGRVLRSEEDDAFEAFLAWHRGKLDATQTNAWRAVYGAEPEDYGKVLDLLDSASRDVEQFGKATAGKIRELYQQAEAEAQRAMRMHKSKAMRARAVDAVWEKYYILRNDTWRRFWDAAEQRWQIAERDVLWGNWSRGARMEAPVAPPKPPVEEVPVIQRAIPEMGAEEVPVIGRPQPGDEEIVRGAIAKADADWTDAEREAIERWTKRGQELPRAEPSIFPAAADIPPYTRTQFIEDLKGISGITDEQADTLTQLVDAAANVWSKRTGRAPEEWYAQYLAGFQRGHPTGYELFQRAENLDTPQFGAWFRDSAVVDEAGAPRVMYHGSPGAGFEWFDPGKTDPDSLFGPGFYFTDAEDVASGYAGKAGIVRFAADDPMDLLPNIRKAAEAAEHPQVRAAREAVDQMTERWENFVEGRPTPYSPKDQQALNLLEVEFNAKIKYFAEQEKLYGNSPAVIAWDMFVKEGPEAIERLFREFGMDTTGVLEQLGAPGVYPVYLSIQNPFDIEAMYSAGDFAQIVGHEPVSMTMTYRGEDIYNALEARALTASQGMPRKQWINRRLQSLGYDGIAHTGGRWVGWKEHQVFIAFEPHQVKSIFNMGDWSTSPHILYQGGNLGAKGAVDFMEDGRALFHFFEGADISTGIHEIGHVFRRTLPDSDMRIVETWAGLGAGDFDSLYPVAIEHQWLSDLPTPTKAQTERMNKIAGAAKRYEAAEEKFARGFERYLAEGKAPVPELESVFQRFKEWLIGIYRQITGSSLDVNLNDKIRGVMDRLLAESPVPRPDDPFGKDIFDIRQARRREEVAGAISAYRGRHPLDIEDARRLFQTEDPQALARALEQQAQEFEQLASRDEIRALAARRARTGKGAERWEWQGWRAGKPDWMAELPTWEQGEMVKGGRVKSASWEKEEYWRIQGIDPSLSTSEKVRATNEFLREQQELAGWYYTLAVQAQNMAAGMPPGPGTIPEELARQSLESMEAYEGLREIDDIDEILRELGYKRSDIFPGEAPERPLPEWAEEFEGAPAGRLYQPEEPPEVGKKYQTPYGVCEVVSVQRGPGATHGWVRIPTGRVRKLPFSDIRPVGPAPPPKAAPLAFGEVQRARPAQMGMFEAGEELPLMTGAPMRAREPVFRPPEVAGEPMLPGMEPAIGDLEKYAARPAGAPPAAAEELRPRRVPKGQMTLWQEPEQMGFWRLDPDQWRQYIDAINQPGATPGPLPHEILQRSTDATRRSLDKIEEGMVRDWDEWQGVTADRQARQALEDWFDNEVVPNWYENRAVAFDYARSQADFSILDYSRRRNFDTWMSYVFPYHYWFTRAGKNWAQRLAKRPGMLANYVRARDAMKLANQQAGRRQRFEGMVGVPFPWLPDWMGDKVYVDPIGLIAPYSQIFGTDWDDADDSKRGLKGIYSTAQRFGLRPYHIWDYLYKTGMFQKAGEMAGMAPARAEEMLGPKYPGNFPYMLPQTGVVKGVTALARELGAETMPPGGINIEAPIRQALGLPAGEIWDPYRINRMLANLAAEQPQSMQLAQATLRAQELVERDEAQTGKVWDPSSELARQTAEEMGWTPEQLAEAQRVLAEAMQKATLERAIGTVGWAAGPRMAIEPTGERAQLEMAEQARAQTWAPEQPAGSREAYEQFKREYPAMYPRSTQYNILPGEKEYDAMAPGARANWLILRQQREMLHEDYDQAVDDLLRAEPWNWSARGDIEDQRRAALEELKAKYPLPEMTGDIPAILYGMNPPEMWDSTVEQELYQMQATKPDPGTFETEEGVDWDAYYKAERKWRAQLPKSFTFGIVQDGKYRQMDPTTAMLNFEQRYDSPLEAAYKLYQQEIASPAWDRYNQAKREEEQLWPGMRDLQDQYWDLPKNQRGAFVQAHPNLPDYWDWKDQQGSAYERTVGQVGAVHATALIPVILKRYQTQGWTEEQLKQELEGVIFPALTRQQELKRGAQAQQGAAGAAQAGAAGAAYSIPPAQYSARELQYQVNRILRQWNARQGRYGGRGGGYRRRYTSSYAQKAGGRWRPRYATVRGGPFAAPSGAIWGGPFRS